MVEQSGIREENVNEAFKRILDGIEKVPTLPVVVNSILELMENPKTSAEDVNRIIRMDQSLAARILKIVNSAFYGFPRQISTVTQAVVILGFNAVKSLAPHRSETVCLDDVLDLPALTALYNVRFGRGAATGTADRRYSRSLESTQPRPWRAVREMRCPAAALRSTAPSADTSDFPTA